MDGCEKNFWGVAMVTAFFQHSLFCDIDTNIFQGHEWSWRDKNHVSGISDLGRAKYVALRIINTFLQ